MKKYVRVFMLVLFIAIFYGGAQAQKKTTTKKSSKKSTVKTVKFTPKEFGNPASISEIKDESESNPEYESVQNLVENNHIKIAYADSTFKPKDVLRRGDFIVAFNSALEAIKRITDSSGVDSSVINTYDKNQSYVTSVSEIKDLQSNSIYYPAVQSLVERWGIAAPFSKTKLLNAGSPMPENDVYDILKVTLGYVSPGSNPYATAMTRGKFATALNNALDQKLAQVHTLASARRDSLDNIRTQQETAMKQTDMARKDSMAKEVELSKMEAQRKEAEAWNKLSEKEKKKQAKTQVKEQAKH